MNHKYYVIHSSKVIVKGDTALDLYIVEAVAGLCRNKKDLSIEMSDYYKNNVKHINNINALTLVTNKGYHEIK